MVDDGNGSAAATDDTAAAGAAAAASSASTDAAAAAAATATAEAEAATAAAAAAEAPKAVDYSSVTLPQDSTLDSAVLERTVAIARERGLSPEQAQAAVDLVNQEVASTRTSLMESYQPGGAEWTKNAEAWEAETLADPALGKTPEERKAAVAVGASVLKRYAEAEPEHAKGFTEFFETSALGNHPAVAKFFHWLGKAAGERSLVHGSDVSMSPGDKLDQMYPSMKKQ